MNILTQKSYKIYPYISRYQPFPYYYHTLDKKYIYGLTSQLKKNINYVLVNINQFDTLDSLAEKYYGRPDLFWVIADFNDILDPFISLFGNYTSIKVPTLGSISFK